MKGSKMEVNEKRGRQGREPSKNFVRNENQEIYFKISRSNITFVYRRFFEGCKICKNTQQIINKLRPIIFSIMAKVIHVHLVGKRQDYYFGSISAVYSILTAEEVGVKKSYLLHAGLSGNGTITTKTAIIKQSTLIRSSRQRKEDLP